MKLKQDLIGYCGICCPECFAYKGKVADASRDLRKILRGEKFHKLATALPFLKGYEQCYQTLGVLVKFRCKRMCKGNGGRPQCPIRICARKRGYEICSQCEDFLNCKKLAKLTQIHGGLDYHMKNLKQIKKLGLNKWIEKKQSESRV